MTKKTCSRLRAMVMVMVWYSLSFIDTTLIGTRCTHSIAHDIYDTHPDPSSPSPALPPLLLLLLLSPLLPQNCSLVEARSTAQARLGPSLQRGGRAGCP
jgi:hypothetical protein